MKRYFIVLLLIETGRLFLPFISGAVQAKKAFFTFQKVKGNPAKRNKCYQWVDDGFPKLRCNSDSHKGRFSFQEMNGKRLQAGRFEPGHLPATSLLRFMCIPGTGKRSLGCKSGRTPSLSLKESFFKEPEAGNVQLFKPTTLKKSRHESSSFLAF